jgi:stage III sporulation protein SpoIIIAA
MVRTDQIKITDDVDLLLDVMPLHIQKSIGGGKDRHSLIEIVLDLGRIPEARYADNDVVALSDHSVTREEIDDVVKRVGRFTEDNRAGIERTLHRISAIRNRLGTIVGLTCRVGRAVLGTVDILRDVIESGRSILLLGRPGVGKTTLLRESARVLADELARRVVIVDTSNEIGGDGDIPHPGIGRARRMQVSSPDRQHAVMIEAVENHMPEVIVIDEIGTVTEAAASRTIAERGVQLIATAHGNTLENLIQNPMLSDLLGGIHAVTLSDEEARRRRTQKTVQERKTAPTFQVLVEIQDKDALAVHHNVAGVVDAFLRGVPLSPETRVRKEDGKIEVRRPQAEALRELGLEMEMAALQTMYTGSKALRIFTYGVSRSRLERVIQKLKVPAQVVADLSRADLILTLKSQQRRQPNALRLAHAGGLPLHVIRSNTLTQMEDFLSSVFQQTSGSGVKEEGFGGARRR